MTRRARCEQVEAEQALLRALETEVRRVEFNGCSYARSACGDRLRDLDRLRADGSGEEVTKGIKIGLRAAADVCERTLGIGSMKLVAVGFAQTLRDLADDAEAVVRLAARETK
jgi:hypothetical protein